MTDIVVVVLVIGVVYELVKSGKLEEVFNQLKNAIPAPQQQAPAPVVEPTPVAEGGGTEATPPAEGGAESAAPAGGGGGGEPVISGTNATLAGCNCSCMNMDSDKTRWKIETPDKKDCYNHIYPPSIEECAKALKEVCAGSCCGGGGGGGATEPAAEGGGDDKAAEGGDDKKSNYVRSCTDYTPMNWA